MSHAEGRLVGGRYHLIEQIGRGGMGVVWRAHDELLDREVAVKEVRYDSAMGDELADLNRRTLREARAAGRLTHPNVVVVHDVIEEDDRPWIVMQLVPSTSLGQKLRQDGPLSPGQTIEIGLQILNALRAAHKQGVLHRDVKPENVLLAEDGRVVLTDFGIARIEADSTMTRTGLVGTPAFIAPERLRGEPARRESDLWSLGATLYATVEGVPPYDRGLPMATMHAVLNEDPAPPKRAGLLGAVLLRMLAKDPADRPGYEELTRLLQQASRGAAPYGMARARSTPAGATALQSPPSTGSRVLPSVQGTPVAPDTPAGTPGTTEPDSAGAPAGSAAGDNEDAAQVADGTPPAGADEPDPRPGETPKPDDEPSATVAGEQPTTGEITSPIPAVTDGDIPATTSLADFDTPQTASPALPEGDPELDTEQSTGRPTGPRDDSPNGTGLSGDRRAEAIDPLPDSAPDPATGPEQPSTPPTPPRAERISSADRADTGHDSADHSSTEGSESTNAGHGNADQDGRRPMPVLKLALLLTPVLLIVAAVAGHLGLQAGERASALPENPKTSTAASAGTASNTATSPSSAETASAAAPPPGPTASPSPSEPAEGTASPSPSVSPEPSPSPSPSSSPSSSASEPADVPKGWYRYTDSTGFSVALPKGWAVSRRSDTRVWFSGPGTPGTLLIDQTSSPGKDAEATWRQAVPGMSRGFPGYKLIRIEAVDYWKTAADWEFTFDGRGGRMHVIDRGFVTDKRHGYAIYWSTPDNRWEKDYHYFATFTATFRPAS